MSDPQSPDVSRDTLFLDDITDPGIDAPTAPPTAPPDGHGPRDTLFLDDITDPGVDAPTAPPDGHGPRDTLFLDDEPSPPPPTARPAPAPAGSRGTLFFDDAGPFDGPPAPPRASRDRPTTPPTSERTERYEARRLLGQGGVGRVTLAFDRELQREVAMKTLLSKRGSRHHAELHRRFIEEARATGQLEHPNIVPIHDMGVDDEGNAWFTMKRIQGVSLAEVLRAIREDQPIGDAPQSARQVFPPRRLIEVLVDICQGVAFAHSHRVLHRDLKPDNVMLGAFGEVLVADWGLAKHLDTPEEAGAPVDLPPAPNGRGDHTLMGQIRGTPSFMSPEQASGAIDQLDARSDVFSLGGILFSLLSGRSPHGELDVQATLEAVTTGRPAELGTGWEGFPTIPRELRAICEKAMAHAPGDRYATVEALRADLEAWLDHRSVEALHDGPIRRLGKWIFRQRVLVGATTGTAILLGLLAGGGWYVDRVQTMDALLAKADASFEKARGDYTDLRDKANNVAEDDPYREQLLALARGNLSQVYRSQLSQVATPLKQLLELDPNHPQGRARLAEVYMELWRLALQDENPELMAHLRQSVDEFTPVPNPYQAELDGLGQLEVTLGPTEATGWLFHYEVLHATGPDGQSLAPRLVPVPFDPKKKVSDRGFLKREARRMEAGEGVSTERPSVHPFETPATSALSAGKQTIAGVPPGSYLLLVQAPGRAEVRLPLVVERLSTATVAVTPPPADAVPEGFVPVLGGPTRLGGETAGAFAPQEAVTEPFLMARLEVTMAEYAAFLAELATTDDPKAVQARLPRDFGRLLATLDDDGQLQPIDPAQDRDGFLASPVRGVSYSDAQAYIAWRSKRDGRAYRLPEDRAWETACRGLDGRRFAWGDQPGLGLAVVSQGYGDTGANMSWSWSDHFDESPWGVHNLAGGVAEWTASPFRPEAGPNDPVHGQLAIRGNAWSIPPVGLECAFRTSGQPDYFHPTIGFRLALDFPTQPGSAKE